MNDMQMRPISLNVCSAIKLSICFLRSLCSVYLQSTGCNTLTARLSVQALIPAELDPTCIPSQRIYANDNPKTPYLFCDGDLSEGRALTDHAVGLFLDQVRSATGDLPNGRAPKSRVSTDSAMSLYAHSVSIQLPLQIEEVMDGWVKLFDI